MSWLTSAMASRSDSTVTVLMSFPVDPDGAGLRIVEARHEVEDRGFARAAAADERDRRVGADGEGKIPHRLALAVCIGERTSSNSMAPSTLPIRFASGALTMAGFSLSTS